MINKLLKASKLTLVTVSLLIGFLGGVVFTVYKSPALTSQLAGAGQQSSNQPNWSQHISHLKESIEKDPNNAEMWAQLANAYYEIQDYPKSIETYLKLISLVEDRSEVYQDLGVVYRRDDQFAKSVEAFEKAFAHNHENKRESLPLSSPLTVPFCFYKIEAHYIAKRFLPTVVGVARRSF